MSNKSGIISPRKELVHRVGTKSQESATAFLSLSEIIRVPKFWRLTLPTRNQKSGIERLFDFFFSTRVMSISVRQITNQPYGGMW